MARKFVVLLMLVGGVPNTLAQPVDIPDIDVDFKRLGAAYALLVSFAAQPEVSAASYSIDGEQANGDDSTLKTAKLPLYREFKSDQHDWRWYLQGAAHYSSLKQKTDFMLGAPLDGTTKFEWTGYGALIEAGFVMPVSNGFSWTAGLGGGVSRLESDADFSNPLLEEAFAPVLDGVVYNWDTKASILRGSLGLLYQRKYDTFSVDAKAHLLYSYIDSFDESSKFGGFSDSATTATVKLDVKYPLDYEIAEHPMVLIGHLGNTNFIGHNRNELGFNSFNELGVSVGVEKLTLGVLGVYGSNVNGWNIILNYDI